MCVCVSMGCLCTVLPAKHDPLIVAACIKPARACVHPLSPCPLHTPTPFHRPGAATFDEPVNAGYMLKMGAEFKTWRKRFFVVTHTGETNNALCQRRKEGGACGLFNPFPHFPFVALSPPGFMLYYKSHKDSKPKAVIDLAGYGVKEARCSCLPLPCCFVDCLFAFVFSPSLSLTHASNNAQLFTPPPFSPTDYVDPPAVTDSAFRQTVLLLPAWRGRASDLPACARLGPSHEPVDPGVEHHHCGAASR